MDSTPLMMYSLLSPIHYENVERYEPGDDYLAICRERLGAGWKFRHKGFWSSCTPEGWAGPEHGWKIHVSATPENASEVLDIVASRMAERPVAFKFCSDPRMLRLSMSKGWSRVQTGKFITLYPRDVDEFKRVIEDLHQATTHLSGPHILTDRPYRKSRVVFYRYGAHAPRYRIDPYGRPQPGMMFSDGRWHEDVRGPAFRVPPGITDPFAARPAGQPESATPSSVLLHDRYRIRGALKFNATGGIYYGEDTRTGEEVIVREVRGMLGHLESEMPDDPAHILHREARILQKLSGTGLVPRFVDIFKEWNHWFLVTERIDAVSLWGHSMEFYFSSDDQSVGFGLDKILATIEVLARGLQTVHAHGVVLRDLTKNNVLFTREDRSIKFIDLEFAYELDSAEKWIRGWTPGYASAEQLASERPRPEDDCYALGVLILDMLTFCASGLELGRANILEKLRLVLGDLGLPGELCDIVEGLIERDVTRRWSIEQALAALARIDLSAYGSAMFLPREDLLEVAAPHPGLQDRIQQTLGGLQCYLDATMDLDRRDRLWPGAPEQFVTNPVSIQYGASGVSWFLLRTRGHVDPRALDWIERQSTELPCPPGLYSGLAGSALLLLEAGRADAAKRIIERAAGHELIDEYPGLYFGTAGWGLANLHFWRHTGETGYLERAVETGNRMLTRAVESEHGLHWRTGEAVYLGLGDGQCGVALFLTYLAAATGEQRFLASAARALDFDIAHGQRVAGRIVWKTHTAAKEGSPNLPHNRFGSAGVGAACLRYHAMTGDARYKEVALDCAYTVRMRISNKIWQDEGCAGYGEFYLDMAEFLEEPRFRDLAAFQAQSILVHALDRPEGTAFTGIDHYRVCCDYSTGGAGIGVFLDRLATGKPRLLFLDELVRTGTR